MTDADILQIAFAELSKLASPRLWMTERGLARRIAKHPEFRGLTQVRLRRILMDHAGSAERPRRIRNSPYPSAKTLEVLWGAIRPDGVREREVSLPTFDSGMLTLPDAGRTESDESESDPDFFLSYNFGDSEAAIEIAELLEAKGHSVWIAGARIVDEEHINDEVIDAMRRSGQHLIYLSANALQSLWVGKEAMFGDQLDLKQTLIVKGDDPDLMEVVHDWMAGKTAADSAGIARYEGVSYLAAWKFREILRAHLAAKDSVIYLFPDAEAADDPRLRPLAGFPTSPDGGRRCSA